MASQLIGFGHFPLPMDDLKSPTHPEIVNREHVRATQIENQEHFDSPSSHALDGSQALQDFRVGQADAFVQRGDKSLLGLLGDFEDVGDFGMGKPSGPEGFRGRSEHMFRLEEPGFSKNCEEPSEDRSHRFAAQLNSKKIAIVEG